MLGTSQGLFPKRQHPKGISPKGSFPTMQFPKRQLPESVLASSIGPPLPKLILPAALGQSQALQRTSPNIWDSLGNCVFGKLPREKL